MTGSSGSRSGEALYDLPFVLEERGLLQGQGATRKREPVQRVEKILEDLGQGYDATGGDNIMYLGDGENVYRLSLGEGAGEMELENGVEVKTRCLGVVDPETYDDLTASGGLNHVLEYLDGQHSVAVDFEDGEFVYPEREEVKMEEARAELESVDRTMFDRPKHDILSD